MWRGMNVSFRDMLFLLVFAYLVIGAVALAHVRKKQEDQSGAAPPGSLIVDIHWDDKIDADVDLWVQRPATFRWGIPTNPASSSTCCATISAIPATRCR